MKNRLERCRIIPNSSEHRRDNLEVTRELWNQEKMSTIFHKQNMWSTSADWIYKENNARTLQYLIHTIFYGNVWIRCFKYSLCGHIPAWFAHISQKENVNKHMCAYASYLAHHVQVVSTSVTWYDSEFRQNTKVLNMAVIEGALFKTRNIWSLDFGSLIGRHMLLGS